MLYASFALTSSIISYRALITDFKLKKNICIPRYGTYYTIFNDHFRANSTLIRVFCQEIQANKDEGAAIFVDNIFRAFLYIYMASSTISRTALNFDHNIILCNKTYELCKPLKCGQCKVGWWSSFKPWD